MKSVLLSSMTNIPSIGAEHTRECQEGEAKPEAPRGKEERSRRKRMLTIASILVKLARTVSDVLGVRYVVDLHRLADSLCALSAGTTSKGRRSESPHTDEGLAEGSVSDADSM